MNKYTTAPLVCDTGVYMNGDLIEVVKHRANAEAVAAILNADARDKVPELEETTHAHWTYLNHASTIWIAACSACGIKAVITTGISAYCPHCGAKMDEEVRQE